MAVATVMLLLPTVINLAIPDRGGDYRQLSVDAFGVDWRIPVTTADGAEVRCEVSTDDFVSRTWICTEGTTITTQFVEGVRDAENTLRRMIRANSGFAPGSDARVAHSADGRAHMLSEQPSDYPGAPLVALSMDGAGDEEGTTAIAVISGDAAQYYASAIWASMAQARGLPYDADLPLEIGADGQDPGQWHLPQVPGQGRMGFRGNEDV